MPRKDYHLCNKHKNACMLGNSRFTSRDKHDILLVRLLVNRAERAQK